MAKQHNDRATSVKQQRRLPPCKPYLAFSIDSILGRKEQEATPNQPSRVHRGNEAYAIAESEERHKTHTEASMDSGKTAHLPWLAYTRYSPPKLPSESVLLFCTALTRPAADAWLGK